MNIFITEKTKIREIMKLLINKDNIKIIFPKKFNPN